MKRWLADRFHPSIEPQIAELESGAGWDEISHLSRVFAQMARQVIEREEALNKKGARPYTIMPHSSCAKAWGFLIFGNHWLATLCQVNKNTPVLMR